MKVKLLFSIILLALAPAAFSQQDLQKAIDSLQKVLPKTKADTTRVNTLNALAHSYTLLNKPLEGITYGEQALQLSQKIHWKVGIARSFENLAISHEYNSDGVKERAYYFKALNAAKASGDKKYTAYIYKELGQNYADGDSKISLQYFDLSLNLYKQINDMDGYYNSLKQKGGTYRFRTQNYLAADCFLKVLKYAESKNDTSNIINNTIYLADIYASQKSYNKARAGYNRARKLVNPKKDNSSFDAKIFRKIGEVYLYQDKFAEALPYYLKRWNILKSTNEIDEKMKATFMLSLIYRKLNNLSKAEEYITRSYEINETNPYQIGKMQGYVLLGRDAFDAKNFTKALEYHLRGLEMAEALKLPYETALAKASAGATYLELAKQQKGNKKELLQKSIAYLQTSLGAFKKTNDYGQLSTFYNYLYQAYELNNDPANALSAYKNYVTNQDSVTNSAKRNDFMAREAEYEYGKKESILKAQQKAALEKEQTTRNFAFAGIGVLVIVAGGAGMAYARKRKDNAIIAREKQRSEDLLLNILPAEVAEELKEKGEASAQYYKQVSILFTDFEGFTKLSEKMSPTEIIGELNYCFKAFDHIITKYNIEKIKTIGDSYMAVSGLPGESPEHALNVVKAALEIRDFIVDYKEQRKQQGKVYFEMRIGINSGEVVAGIVGIKKFAYDIWGDAVNIASRMETNGQVGKVNISETTYDLVKDYFDTEYRGEINAKGKGAVKMYFAEPKQTTNQHPT